MDTWSVVESQIQKTIETHLPSGAGTMTEAKLRQALEAVAKTAWREAESQVLTSLLTVEDLAEKFGISERRMRIIAVDRHRRFGVGWKTPGRWGAWLFLPSEIEILRPGPPGNPMWRKKSDP